MTKNTQPTKPRTLLTALADAVIDNATSPANAFAAANWTAIAGEAGVTTTDHAVAATALTLTFIGTTRDSLKDRAISTPFYALGAINYTLAVLTLKRAAENGFDNQGSVLLAISLFGWATGHMLNAHQISHDKKPKGILDNGNTHYGYSDLTAIHISPPPSGVNTAAVVLGGLGLTRTFFENAMPEKIREHITPPRLYALSYLAGAIGTSIHSPQVTEVLAQLNPNMAAMQLQAAWAYVNFDVNISGGLKNAWRRITGQEPLSPPSQNNDNQAPAP